jgi:quinoprotein glucose dehydrogenase
MTIDEKCGIAYFPLGSPKYINSSDGLPANKPPWSTITAYDLNKGTIKWQIPWGSVTDTGSQGNQRYGKLLAAGRSGGYGRRSDLFRYHLGRNDPGRLQRYG